MSKTMFSRTIISLFACVMFYAAVGSAQSCPATVNGFYTYTATGNGVPGALITAGTPTGTGTTGTGTKTTVTAAPFSNTGVGQLVNGTTNSVPFASTGSLYFDGSGNIRANSTPQFALTSSMVVGTYTLNSGCTISVTLNDAFGNNTTKATLQGVILGDGSEIDLGFLQTVASSGTGTGNSSGTSSIATGMFQSNMLIRLVRPLANFCSATTLAGFRMFIVATGTSVSNSGITIGTGKTATTGSITGMPFFVFGRVQFDGSGNLIAPSGTQSSLGLQLVGTYTVNNDCTGTLNLNLTNGTTGTTTGSTTGTTSNSSLPLNFVLTAGNESSSSSTPEIQFTQSNGMQLLFGSGQLD
jgi:hypothetical protein